MTTPTVLVLPTGQHQFAEIRRRLLGAHPASVAIEPVPGPVPALAARVCASINLSAPAGPLHVVAFGSTATMLPAVALSQRVARRRVAEYVLVDPDFPDVTDAWPDAPVAIYATDDHAPASRQGRLRGWSVLPIEALAAWTPIA